ncbi:hypothetical protein ANRL1_01970 [Anaerolineae bacterium]|nr:hypothetical protein ANRL1_01970 [Anaerolineae bacterium]
MIEFVGAAFAFVVYLATMPPSLTWAHYGADGGDLVTAIARGALPHPPGFPAYVLAGDWFIRIPFGEPAWCLNLLSAMFAAGAVGLTIAAARRLGVSAIATSVAGLMLAFAPLFWSQAIIVEVYAFAAFGASLVMYLALRGAPAWLVGFILGIGMGAHPILFFCAPIVLVCRCEERSLRRSNPQPPSWRLLRRFTARNDICIAFLLAWLVMYGVVLVVPNRAMSPWGDLTTIGGWWSFVSGQIYRGYVFTLPLAELPQRLIAFAATLIRQFTPLGAIIAGVGAWRLWREQRGVAFASLAAFALVSIFAIGYNTADSIVYLVIALPIAGLWLALGLEPLTFHFSRFTSHATRHASRVILLLLPLVSLALYWNEMNLHDDRAAIVWADQILSAAPPNAILVTERDAHTFTLWYARDVLQRRTDVIVLDRDLWQYESYRKMMAAQFGFADDLVFEFEKKDGRSIVEVPR